jgi:hypothetical protein
LRQQPQPQLKLQPQQPQAQTSVHSPEAQRKLRKPVGLTLFRPHKRWTEDKEWMTAEEIDLILRIQEQALMSENPFLDDFYYQIFRLHKLPEGTPKFIPHRPLFEYLESANKPKNSSFDAQRVLGRSAFSTARAPRPIVQLEDEKANDSGAPNIQKVRYLRSNSRSFGTNHSLLLAIEHIWDYLLEIEDLDIILHALNIDINDARFSNNGLVERRKRQTEAMFRALRVHLPPTKELPPLTQPNSTFYCPEDEFLLKVTMNRKGVKLLSRCLFLLFPSHQFAVIFQYMRNLLLLASTPKNDEDENRMRRVFDFILTILNASPIEDNLIYFQSLLASHPQPRLTQLLKTKLGVLVCMVFMRRGYELLLSLESLPNRTSNNLLLVETWKKLYNQFYERLLGKIGTLCSGDISVGHSNRPTSSQIWELFTQIALNATDSQKAEIHKDLK